MDVTVIARDAQDAGCPDPRIFDSAQIPASAAALADLRATVGGADLAAPPVVLPDFHHKSNMELPSSVAVATRNSVPDVVLPGETGLLAGPERPLQLAAAIKYMLDEPAEAARMAIAARRLIADRFTPESLAVVLDAAYRSGTGPARTRPRVAFAQPA